MSGLEMNYDLTESLTVTSVTGYYSVDLDNFSNYTASYNPVTVLPSRNLMKIDELSEELRLTSNFDGRVNFMTAAYYQDSDAETGSHTYVGTPGSAPLIPGTTAPFELNHYYLKQKGEAYSFFAQVQFDITSQLELSGGARYSHEEKELTSIVSLVPGNPDPVPITPLVSKVDFSNTSPEVSLTWRPSDTLTIYGSYKEGFLSGGFNGSSGASAALSGTDLTYDEETVKGYEAGLKTILFDGALQANLALYSYDIEGLQVVVTTQGVIQELKNAGAVSSDGIEFDFNWETPLEGLSIHGAAAYADGQYDDYQAACYRGQTASSPVPCLLQESRVTHQVALLQDLSGTDLLRSPEWAGNIGAVFDRPISSGLKLVLSADLSYSDDYLTDATSKPRGISPSYQILDASVRLAELNDRWGVSLIGKNLTGEYFWVRNSDAPFSGSAPSGTAGVGVLGDSVASINRGPEVLLRVDFRFGAD
jgi:iron complex outermembrane receptor protein